MRPLLLLAASLLALDASGAPPRHRVAALPLVTLGPGVPPRAVSQTQAMLAQQLAAEPALQLVLEPGVGELLAPAREAVEAARAARARHDLPGADEALGRALLGFRAAAFELAGPDELREALTLRALVRRGLGRDEEAAADLAAAVALGPDRELPLARASSGLARAAAEAAAALKGLAPGSLTLESTPPGAAALLDGHLLGPTPLEVQGVPPGAHLWQLRLPVGGAVGGLVDVGPGRRSEVREEAPRATPLARLQRAVAGGRLDAAALADAAEVALVLEAPWLVLGALRREGDGLALEALLVVPARGLVRRLPPLRFDVALLSAATALAGLTEALGTRGEEAGVGAALPVALAAPAPGALSRVRYPLGPAAPSDADLPEPVAPPRRRVPLTAP